jgi:hypothetical protein
VRSAEGGQRGISEVGMDDIHRVVAEESFRGVPAIAQKDRRAAARALVADDAHSGPFFIQIALLGVPRHQERHLVSALNEALRQLPRDNAGASRQVFKDGIGEHEDM